MASHAWAAITSHDGTTDAGRVDPARPQPEVLRDVDRLHRPEGRGAEAVDVVRPEAGIDERPPR